MFCPLWRQIIPIVCLPPLIPNFDNICRFSVNSAKACYLSQSGFTGYCWSFPVAEPVFSISYWIVEQPQQAPPIRYLSLCSSKIRRHSSNLLIRRWQWTGKYENEQRDSLDSLGGWLAGKTFVIAQPGQEFIGDRNASSLIKTRDDERVSVLKQKKHLS